VLPPGGEVEGEVARRGIAIGGVLREEALDEEADGERDRGGVRRQRLGSSRMIAVRTSGPDSPLKGRVPASIS
jgi:hypothetical protein